MFFTRVKRPDMFSHFLYTHVGVSVDPVLIHCGMLKMNTSIYAMKNTNPLVCNYDHDTINTSDQFN